MTINGSLKYKTYPEHNISPAQASTLASSLTDPSTLQMLKKKLKLNLLGQ